MGFNLQDFMDDLINVVQVKGLCPEDRLEFLAELVLNGYKYATECGQINKEETK